MASCALLPELAPIELGGQLLGDGGFSDKASFDLVLSELAATQKGWVSVILELFSRKDPPVGADPHGQRAGISCAA